ncbi:MAG: DoxX family membrane protein [Lacisediminihabitans sp.]
MDAAAVELGQWILRVVLALTFIGMGVTHFVPSVARTMAAMIPPILRTRGLASPRNLVYFTGVCEIAGGVGLLIPALQFAAGIALAIFLVAVFPANAYAASHREKFGRAAIPFWPRLAGQLVLIALCILAAL